MAVSAMASPGVGVRQVGLKMQFSSQFGQGSTRPRTVRGRLQLD